ncbi:MAG: hypothetical protein Kow0092_03920 [Deferrisomatales bacterium]
MSGKRAVVALIVALVAFGYVFTLNPGMAEFQIYPGARVNTSFALILFLFFLAGFGLAVFATAFKEAARSFFFWRHRKGDERREEAKRLVIQGRGLAVLGRTRLARKLLQKAHRKAAGEPLVALEMARVEMADGLQDRAEKRLKALLEDDAKNPEVLQLLLDLYRDRGDFEGQVATLTRWLEADPKHVGALRHLRDLYRSAGNWAEAVRTQEKILALAQGRKDRSAERRVLSELRLRQAKAAGPARSRGMLERLVREDGEFAPAHALLGDALLELGDRDGAVQAWVRGYHATGQAGLLLKAEQVRVAEGKAGEILQLYKKLGKKGGVALLLRARLLLILERAKEAFELLEQADAELRDSRIGRLLLGEALFRLRSYDEAVKAFRHSALGADENLPLPFACRRCGNGAPAWNAVCPRCEGVDTVELRVDALPGPPVPAAAS